jgi:short-subunit dehydrogenase
MSTTSPRVVVLTGAAHGIGRATALALAARGHRLGLIDRDADALGVVADRLRDTGASAVAATADVTDTDALRAAVAAIEAAIGPTETLLACAGIGALTLVPTIDPAGLRRMLDVNVVGVAQAIDAVLPGMIARGAGHIVGIASVAGYRGLPWMPAYSASKAALATYLEGLRPGLKRRGIVVTTVYPGFVRTALTRDAPFRRPVAMLEPEQAAPYLVRAVERRPRDLVFPRSAALGMGLLRRLPNRLFDWAMDRAGPRALTVEF